MIKWIFNRWWAWRNRAELDELDRQSDFLSAESERLDHRMEEEFGPNWRQKSEERLKAIMSCRFTQT